MGSPACLSIVALSSALRVDDAVDVARALQPLAHRAAPLADAAEVTVDVDGRIVFQRDDQRALDQIELLVGPPRDLHETLPRERGMGQDAHRSLTF